MPADRPGGTLVNRSPDAVSGKTAARRDGLMLQARCVVTARGRLPLA